MNISGFQAGMSGLQRGMNDVAKAADDIVKTGVQTSQSTNVGQVQQDTGQGDVNLRVEQSSKADKGNNDLAKSLVDLKVGQKVFDASAKVVKTADEMLGTIIDTKA